MTEKHPIDHMIKYVHSRWWAGVDYRFTLAWSVSHMEQEGHGDPCFIIHAGAAFCSPKDNFSKIRGRELAYAHLRGSGRMTFRQYAGGAMDILGCFGRYLSKHAQGVPNLPRKVRECWKRRQSRQPASLNPDQLAARKMRREVSREARVAYASAREEGWSRQEILQTICATTAAETIRRRMQQRSERAGGSSGDK